MSFVDKKIENVSFDIHMQNKSMWLGSKDKVHIPYFRYDTKSNQFFPSRIICSPARLKLIDETVANAIDHFIECNSTKYPVKRIYVDIGDNGKVTILNDGPGFQLSPIVGPGETKIWSVEFALTNLMAGSNVTKDADITAGTNGVGLKGVVCHSKEFKITTIDPRCGVMYSQTITDCMKSIKAPTLVLIGGHESATTNSQDKELVTFDKLNELIEKVSTGLYGNVADKSYTKIEYQLEDKLFNDNDVLNLKEEVKNYIMSQLALSTIFILGHGKDMDIRFNKIRIKPSIKALPIKYPVFTKILCTDGTYWNIVLGYSNVPEKFKLQNITVINGMFVSDNGDHVTHIRKQIGSVCQAELNKLQEKNGLKPDNKRLYNKIFISVFSTLKNPQWRGQTKDYVTIPKDKIKSLMIDKDIVLKFWSNIKDDIEKSLASMRIKEENKKNKKRAKTNLHTPAPDIKKKSVSCTLFIPEGDSAQSMIRGGLSVCKEISRTSCGIFNITGVPMNVRKQVKAKKLEKQNQMPNQEIIQGQGLLLSDEELEYDPDYLPNNALLKNERFIELMLCIGLQIVPERNDMFDLTPTGDSEFSKLNYKTVILTVDQDYDGRGHICGLILNFFALFYPNLLRRGFVKYLRTPLIRVYNKEETRRLKSGVFYNFYSDIEYRRWVEGLPQEDTTLIDDSIEPSGKWYVVYYKGLAGHNKGEEVDDIFLNFNKNVVTFKWDENAAGRFEAYYGKDTATRKSLLSTPFTIPVSYYEQLKTGNITCSEHLDYETRSYQMYVLSRKLKCMYDGLVPSQRKVLHYALRKLGRDNKAMRVVDLAAGSVEPTKYHHGPKSLEDVVIRMAQRFVGSNTLPYFIGLGEFGSREFGRKAKHAGSARYIKVRLNKRLTDKLLPSADLNIVPYVYEEGSRCEPKFFIPIIPMSVIDSTTTPACGWKIDNWGRDVKTVFRIVRYLIDGVQPFDLINRAQVVDGMKIFTQGQYVEYCIGDYHFDKDKMEVTISQLPLQVWYGPYKVALLKRPYIKNIIDKCSTDNIELVIQLIPDRLPFEIEDSQDMENLLELGKYCKQILNMTDENGNIMEYTHYIDVVSDWFKKRKSCYELRLERERLLLKIRIKVQESVLQFVVSKIQFVDMTEVQAIKLLEDRKFQKVNSGLLTSPGCIRNDQLEEMIFGFNANYNYLFKQNKFKETKEGEQKLRTKIEGLKKQLEDLLNTTYKECWLKELVELEEVVDHGLRTNWTYNKNERFD